MVDPNYKNLMVFNFVLKNLDALAVNSLSDLLSPIYAGLTECGHHVIGVGTRLMAAPVVNLFVESFHGDAFTEELLGLKKTLGEKFIFGIICAEDISDEIAMQVASEPQRRVNLLRLLPEADFVWTLLPQKPLLDSLCHAERTALVEYGFAERCLDPYPVRDVAGRDLDCIIYGNDSPYRSAVTEALGQQGLSYFVGYRELYPNFVADDAIRRAKVLIDLRRRPDVRFLSPTRIVKGLHFGVPVVSERFDASEIAKLYAYTEACPYNELAARCQQIIRQGNYIERGMEALGRFRTETSMRDNMRRALSLPVFQILGRG
jgi:hypothetical protein